MAKLSKRAKVIREKVDPNKAYSLEEAVALLSELSTVKFKESLDVAINLGVIRVNPIRSYVALPSCLTVLAKTYA